MIKDAYKDVYMRMSSKTVFREQETDMNKKQENTCLGT